MTPDPTGVSAAMQALLPPLPGGAPVAAGYNLALSDLSGFHQALNSAAARLETQPLNKPSLAVQQVFKPFEHINAEAASLANDAQVAKAAGREMTPSEVVMLTVRSTEFMFHCQLTSNIANRTSDGLQQLFRQQA